MDNKLKLFQASLNKVLVVINYPPEQISSYVIKSTLLVLERALIGMGSDVSRKDLDSFHEIVERFDQQLALEKISKIGKIEKYEKILEKEVIHFFNTFASRLKDKTSEQQKTKIQEILEQFASSKNM